MNINPNTLKYEVEFIDGECAPMLQKQFQKKSIPV